MNLKEHKVAPEFAFRGMLRQKLRSLRAALLGHFFYAAEFEDMTDHYPETEGRNFVVLSQTATDATCFSHLNEPYNLVELIQVEDDSISERAPKLTVFPGASGVILIDCASEFASGLCHGIFSHLARDGHELTSIQRFGSRSFLTTLDIDSVALDRKLNIIDPRLKNQFQFSKFIESLKPAVSLNTVNVVADGETVQYLWQGEFHGDGLIRIPCCFDAVVGMVDSSGRFSLMTVLDCHEQDHRCRLYGLINEPCRPQVQVLPSAAS